MFGIVWGGSNKSYKPRSYTTPAFEEAFANLFKMSVLEMLLKVDGYITNGLVGMWETHLLSFSCALILY